MVQTLQANTVTLDDLHAHFGLQLATSYQFFPEWINVQIELTESEQASLDRIRTNFLYLSQSPPMVDNAVKLVVLSPLLDLAGSYSPPFRIRTEVSMAITA